MAADSLPEYYEPGIELPADEGRDLILRACTGCHTLEGVPAYRKYWGYTQWLPMVENMVKHGAKLDAGEMDTVARYLGHYFGKDALGDYGNDAPGEANAGATEQKQ